MRASGNLVLKPAGKPDIIVRNPVNFPMDHGFGDILDLFGRYACINTAGFADRAFQHNGAGGNDRITPYFSIIHDNCTHSNQHIIMYAAAMYNGIMPDGNIVPDDRFGFVHGGMDDRTILYVYLIAHADTVYVAANNGIEPETALVTRDYIPNNGGIGCQETVGPKLRVSAFNM